MAFLSLPSHQMSSQDHNHYFINSKSSGEGEKENWLWKLPDICLELKDDLIIKEYKEMYLL